MLNLKIKKPGLMINIPGLTPFRTPAEVDISKLDLRSLVSYLKANSIEDYEILAQSKTGQVDVYKKEDFEEVDKKKKKKEPDLEKRFSKLEKMLEFLISKSGNNEKKDSEQISKKLERLERLIQTLPKETKVVYQKDILTNPKVEELEDSFIPDIDISDMKMSSGSYKEIENQSKKEVDESADLLAGLLGKK